MIQNLRPKNRGKLMMMPYSMALDSDHNKYLPNRIPCNPPLNILVLFNIMESFESEFPTPVDA
jgi:hypothetical protein